MELGNLVAIALVFGQFLDDRPFSLQIFIGGVVIVLLFYLASYIIDL